MQGVARLEFWEIVEYNDEQLNQSLFAINDKLVKEKTASSSLKETLALENKETVVTDQTSGDSTKSALEEQLSQVKDSSSNLLDSLTNTNLSPLFSLSLSLIHI